MSILRINCQHKQFFYINFIHHFYTPGLQTGMTRERTTWMTFRHVIPALDAGIQMKNQCHALG
ncbi:hypothetical protein IYZ83_000930 [Wolbachia pipientis]|uniref:hypothetical protein n=1 Tax=Wolbachia pipientis TaxID=955 RepID=UPI001F1D7995|nr:hypothetical protein [Wolbachia pipientis]UIP91821.1 hypothetical protein IYZ83_000930 [Wolbachia pipientis]